MTKNNIIYIKKIFASILIIFSIILFTIIYLTYIKGIIFLWESPTEYRGKTLEYHHFQLIDEGFSFVGFHKQSGITSYLYKKKEALGVCKYIELEKYENCGIDDEVESATKYFKNPLRKKILARCSIELADDPPIKNKEFENIYHKETNEFDSSLLNNR